MRRGATCGRLVSADRAAARLGSACRSGRGLRRRSGVRTSPRSAFSVQRSGFTVLVLVLVLVLVPVPVLRILRAPRCSPPSGLQRELIVDRLATPDDAPLA